MLLFETVLAFSSLLLALVLPGPGPSWLRRIEKSLSAIANNRVLAVVVIGIATIALRIAVLPVEPIPIPGIHDEFGYLLSGDTFAHWRLTNPAHPMWMHFESMTIIQRPTYCSAFWPAQGLFLGFGKIVMGHPFWGVLLSSALMCAASCWALQGWMPPTWAFLGGSLTIMQVGIFTYWTNSYWGGAVPALGGALVFGALARIKRQQRSRDAVMMAVGLSLLAASRPYEGLVFSLPILVSLLVFLFGRRSLPLAVVFSRVILPMAAVIAVTFGLMGYLFWRSTGNPLRPPYLVNIATYILEPQFIFQSLTPTKNYNHAVMQQFYTGYHVQLFLQAQRSPIINSIGKLLDFFFFFVGPLLLVPFCVLAGILCRRPCRLGSKTFLFVSVISVTFLGLFLTPFFNPHYAAPVVCVAYALILQAMRRVRIWDKKHARGVWLIRLIVISCITVFLYSWFGLAAQIPRSHLFPYDSYAPNVARSKVAEEVEHHVGKQLIIVRYSVNHDYHKEWVYNDADIDDSKTVWARDMGPQKNRRTA